jgi:membrane-bound lytic murein transglycosylase MltF
MRSPNAAFALEPLGFEDELAADFASSLGVRPKKYAKQDELDWRLVSSGYNCGPGHVQDARRLAKDMRLDANRWFGNVEKAVLLSSEPKYARQARNGYCLRSEAVKYVSEIQSRYDAYSKLVPLD